MKTAITLEEALSRSRPGLRYRIEQSVALLRKAEKLALMYDNGGGIILLCLLARIVRPFTM